MHIKYNDNENYTKHYHWKLSEKVSTATLFSHGFDLSAPCEKTHGIMEITNFTSFLIVLLFYMLRMTKPNVILNKHRNHAA